MHYMILWVWKMILKEIRGRLSGKFKMKSRKQSYFIWKLYLFTSMMASTLHKNLMIKIITATFQSKLFHGIFTTYNHEVNFVHFILFMLFHLFYAFLSTSHFITKTTCLCFYIKSLYYSIKSAHFVKKRAYDRASFIQRYNQV